MSTRAKFRCIEKTELHDGFKVKLQPMYSPSAEDQSFFKYTPYGELTMGLLHAETAAQFKVGTDYYIDFNEVVPVAVVAAPVTEEQTITGTEPVAVTATEPVAVTATEPTAETATETPVTEAVAPE